eukprot:TRINITY_DN6352_c0_g1_i1.p1 TRINITY_DN6352_c0_g1~~TRINITY_DN6352_c0_g1_i1.p1  ORF type:complete len:278 (-),score=41.98 TRINITY_DN6352_c0_g1_i1:434-1267(-)
MQYELKDVAENKIQDMENFKREFNRSKQDIFRFVTDVNQFRQLVSKLGSARDTVDFRKRINNLQGDLTERAHKIGNNLIDLKNFSKTAGPMERHEVDKLIGETQDQLQRFKSVQQECKRAMERSLPSTGRTPDSAGDQGIIGQQMMPLQSQQQQLQEQQHQQQAQTQQEMDPLLQSQITFHEELIQERDQGIREINNQIAEVNDIFQDLAVLVTDQGETVEVIDNNMTNVGESVERGRRELVVAQRHQKGATKRMWCLFVIALVVLSVILVVVITSM